MINLSIVAIDFEEPFDSTIHEIESAFKLVIEVEKNKGDIMPEQDKPNPENETCFLFLEYIFPSNSSKSNTDRNFTIKRQIAFVLFNYKDPVLTFQFPPPKPDTQSLFS